MMIIVEPHDLLNSLMQVAGAMTGGNHDKDDALMASMVRIVASYDAVDTMDNVDGKGRARPMMTTPPMYSLRGSNGCASYIKNSYGVPGQEQTLAGSAPYAAWWEASKWAMWQPEPILIHALPSYIRMTMWHGQTGEVWTYSR